MTDSYAGISVPEGSVGDLRQAGSRLIQQAQVLTDSSTSLQAMLSAGSWIGPAHGQYANRCVAASTAARLAAGAFINAASAAEAYADALQSTQKRARDAIHDARDAQKRIDHSSEQISAAQGRRRAAETRIDAAVHAQSIAALAGGDTSTADAMLQEASDALRAAQDDERTWTHRLHAAQHDLDDARKRGRDAEQDAKDAAATAQTMFAAAGGAMPMLIPPPQAAAPKKADSGSWFDKATGWAWKQVKAVPGSAKDATVDSVTGLVNMVGDGLEYRYNSIAHPELAMQYEMDQQRAQGEVIFHPVKTVKTIVNWDDLSHGRIGEWVGGMAPDAVVAALTAGGGTAVRVTRSTATVEEMGGSAALRRAQGNLTKARDTHAGLAPPSDFSGKTVASTKPQSTLIGWAHEGRDLPGIRYVPPDQVQSMANDMQFKIRGAGAMDQGVPGRYHASHAEAQHTATVPGQPIGVDRPMCTTCQSMVQHAANYSHQPMLVHYPADLPAPGAMLDPVEGVVSLTAAQLTALTEQFEHGAPSDPAALAGLERAGVVAGGVIDPAVADMLAAVQAAAMKVTVQHAGADAMAWRHEGRAVLLLALDAERRQLTSVDVGRLPGILADLLEIGPRPTAPERTPLTATVEELGRLFAERGDGPAAGSEGAAGAAGTPPGEGDAREPVDDLAGLVARHTDHWRIDAVSTEPPVHAILEAFDAPGGYWLVRPERDEVRIEPTTAAALWAHLAELAE